MIKVNVSQNSTNHQVVNTGVNPGNFFQYLQIVFDKFGIMLNIPQAFTPFIRPNLYIRFDINMMKYFTRINYPSNVVPTLQFNKKEVLWREIDLFGMRLQFVDRKGNYLELNIKSNIDVILQQEERTLKLQSLNEKSGVRNPYNNIDYETFIDLASKTNKDFRKWFKASIQKALTIRKRLPVPNYFSGQVGFEYLSEGGRIGYFELIKFLKSRDFSKLLRQNNKSGKGYLQVFIRKIGNQHQVYSISFIPLQLKHEKWGLGYSNININDFIFFKCLYEHDHTQFNGWMKK